MNIYYYFAVKKDNSRVSGIEFANNKSELMSNLYKLKEYLLFCVTIPQVFIKLKTTDVILILKHVKYQLDSGENLFQAVKNLLSINESIKFKYFLTTIYQKLSIGESIAISFKTILNEKELLFLDVMEKYGSIKKSIIYLVRYIEFNSDLKKLLKSKLSYPCFLCVFVLGIFFTFLYYVFPKISFISDDRSNFEIYFFVFLIFFIFLVIYYVIALRFFKKVLFFDFILKNLVRNFHTVIFATTLSVFLSSGIFFVKSIDIIRKIYKDSFFKNYMNDIADSLQKGECIYEVFYKYKRYFRMDFIETLKIAEINNEMPEMISKYSEKLYTEIKEEILALTNKLAIYCTVIAGVILIIILSNVLDPIYKFVQDIESVI